MVTVFLKTEIERDGMTVDQLLTVGKSDAVFIVDVENQKYEIVKNRYNGVCYDGHLDDFSSDLADALMDLSEWYPPKDEA